MEESASSTPEMFLRRSDDADDVLRTEREYVLADRAPELGTADEIRGLAISGGGIRSASFGLGILQALVAGKVLPKIDYLSTVSGGGYIGSSLTWFLNQGFPGGRPAGTTPEDFPFGKKHVGARMDGESARNSVLDFIRQHGNYLVPGSGLGFVSLLAVVLRAMVVSLLVYFCLIAAIFVPAVQAKLFWPLTDRLPNSFASLGSALLVLFALLSVLYSLQTYLVQLVARAQYKSRTVTQRWFGRLLVFSALLLVVGSLPMVDRWFDSAASVAGGSTLVGAILGVLRQIREQHAKKPGGRSGQLLPIVAAAAVIYGLLLGAYLLAVAEPWDAFDLPWYAAAAGLAAIGLLVGSLVNLNYLAPHRMYRDRLMETFLPDLASVETNRWGLATASDGARIEDMCRAPNRRPYHLVNANVVLVASPEAKFEGRGGDSFVLSPLFCGSNATGWVASNEWMKRGGRGMTLATAMAISGAAANPNAGVAGHGLTRNRLVSALMTLLNIRLGYWAPNPRNPPRLPFPPNFLRPGLPSLFGVGQSETRGTIELTDGGHFENLGIYELVRRHAKVIIASDGGCDSGFRFDDLTNAIQRVRVDFGVQITFEDPHYDLTGLQPGSAADQPDFLAEKYGLAQRGFAIGAIRYPDETVGTLIYFKATVTPKLSADIYGYKSANREFPHQTTADQFFDESQFEAYRELGYYLGWQMLEANGQSESLTASSGQSPWI